jgi:hypothetical protein
MHYCLISYPTLKLSFQECISTLTEETKDDLIRRMFEKHPVCVRCPHRVKEQGGYHPDHRLDNEPPLTWCRCTHCREMPTEAETVCCDQAPHNCYSRLQVCHFYLHTQLEVHILFTLEYMTAPFH